MNSITSYIIYLLFPTLLGIGTFIIKNFNNVHRIEVLEEKMLHTITEPEVRQILIDRYDRDIQEIKQAQQKLLELYIQSLSKNQSNKDD